MVTTIVTSKAVDTASVDVVTPQERVKLVDELGELKTKLERAKPMIARVAEIEKVLRAYVDKTKVSNEETVIHGDTWELKVGKKPWVRKIIDKLKALKFLTEDVALEKVTIPLAVLDDYLTPPEREQILSKTRDGTRPLKISKR